MPIAFQCPVCRAQLEVADAQGGQLKNCPQCNELMRVPDAPKAAVAPPAEPEKKRAPDRPPAPKKESDPKRAALIAAVDLYTIGTVARPGYRVGKTFPMIAAHRVEGARFFRDLLVATREIVEDRLEKAEKLFADLETEVLRDLQEKALNLGASAVIGVTLQRVDVSGKSEVYYLTAHGTPVLLVKAE